MDPERQVIWMPKYQKAYICPYRKGRPVLEKKIYVPFNPSELSIEEAIGVSGEDEEDVTEELKRLLKGSKVGWQRPAEPTLARRKKGQLTLSVTLFFNTLHDLYQDSYEDVRTYISQLYPYTNKTADISQTVEQIYFFWGSIAVAGMLNRMHVHYSMFAPDGKPVRAQVELSIKGDYVGDQSCGTIAAAATGEISGLAGKDTKLMMVADPSAWRTLFGGLGNPRL